MRLLKLDKLFNINKIFSKRFLYRIIKWSKEFNSFLILTLTNSSEDNFIIAWHP